MGKRSGGGKLFKFFYYLPDSPLNTWESPQAYMDEVFPVEDMLAYTMELKGWLDKASIIMDTSVYGRVLFTTCYEDDVLKPDAFSIWQFNEWEETPASFIPLGGIHSDYNC